MLLPSDTLMHDGHFHVCMSRSIRIRINSCLKIASAVLGMLMLLLIMFSIGYFSSIFPTNPSLNDCLSGGLIQSQGKG